MSREHELPADLDKYIADLRIENINLKLAAKQAQELLRKSVDIKHHHAITDLTYPVRAEIESFLASQQGEQPECGCCGQTGPCDPDCDTLKHPEQAEGAQGERERFENDPHFKGMDFSRPFLHPEIYTSSYANGAWDGWRHGRAALAQPSPAPELERATGYAEARQCANCRHIGINDSSGAAACHDCDWRGPEPAENKCPGCGNTNCMAASCPECGGRYELMAEAKVAGPVAQAAAPLPPFAEKVLAKLRRFYDCAEDFESGGVDIGRHWLDLLTRLGLLNRVQRSPALWEISQQGADLLEAPVAQAGQAPEPCKHVFIDDGMFTVACTACGLNIKAEPSHAVLEQARQEAFDAGGDEHGCYSLDGDELDQIVANACAMAVIEYAAAPAQGDES